MITHIVKDKHQISVGDRVIFQRTHTEYKKQVFMQVRKDEVCLVSEIEEHITWLLPEKENDTFKWIRLPNNMLRYFVERIMI